MTAARRLRRFVRPLAKPWVWCAAALGVLLVVFCGDRDPVKRPEVAVAAISFSYYNGGSVLAAPRLRPGVGIYLRSVA